MGRTWLHVRYAEYVLNVLVDMGPYHQPGVRIAMTAVTTNFMQNIVKDSGFERSKLHVNQRGLGVRTRLEPSGSAYGRPVRDRPFGFRST